MTQTNTDDVFKEIHNLENRVSAKIAWMANDINTQIEAMSTKITSLSNQFGSLSDSFLEYKVKTDKIDSILEWQTQTEDKIIKQDIRIKNLDVEWTNAKFKYDKIFLDNIAVPGFIGESGKYKTLGEYILENIKQVGSLVTAKERDEMVWKKYKADIEKLIGMYENQVSILGKQQAEYCWDVKKELWSLLEIQAKEHKEDIKELMIENSKGSVQLKLKSEELKEEAEKWLQLKHTISKHFDEKVREYQIRSEQVFNSYAKFISQFKNIKNRFAEVIEFIKDVRFRKNLVNFDGVKRKEIIEWTNKIDFKKKKQYSDNEKEVDMDYDLLTGLRAVPWSGKDEKNESKNSRSGSWKVNNNFSNKNDEGDSQVSGWIQSQQMNLGCDVEGGLCGKDLAWESIKENNSIHGSKKELTETGNPSDVWTSNQEMTSSKHKNIYENAQKISTEDLKKSKGPEDNMPSLNFDSTNVDDKRRPSESAIPHITRSKGKKSRTVKEKGKLVFLVNSSSKYKFKRNVSQRSSIDCSNAPPKGKDKK